jgi:DNA polymerase-1
MLEHIKVAKVCAIDIETTGRRHWRSKIRSIQFSPSEKWAYYVPILEHKDKIKYADNPIEVEDIDDDGKPRKTTLYPYWAKEEEAYIWGEIKKILLDPEIFKCGQNFKFDMKFLLHYLFPKDYDVMVASFVFDTMLASYLLNENSSNKLKDNAYLHFADLRGYAQTVQQQLSDKDEEAEDWTKLKLEVLAPYGCGDTDATIRLANLYGNKLFKSDAHADTIDKFFYNFYMVLSKIMTKAERVGIGLDIPRMENVRDKYVIEKDEIENEILTMAGKETDAQVRARLLELRPDLSENKLAALTKKEKLNLNSSQQLGKLLFDEMKLPIQKVTKTGQPSTDKETLKALAIEYPFCRRLVIYKNRLKMISTYFNGALKELEPDGTIVKGFPMLHFDCNLIGTVTGRTSYKKYPIQTVPRIVDVRSIICAPPGYYLVEWDLSQIELRLAAWYSQDPVMLKEYREGIDIHTETLKFMTGMTSEELVKLKKEDPDEFKELRKKAKGFNFGGLYGGSAETLASHLNEKIEEGEAPATEAEAQAHIDYWFGKYQGLKIYYDKVIDSASRKGYVKSCFGRVRRLPILTQPLTNDIKKEVSEAHRQALNSVIQGTASDITKFAMIELHNYIQLKGLKSIISFDVHDAMIALVKEEELKEVVLKGMEFMQKERPPIMKNDMEILAEAEIFRNWKIPIPENELNLKGLLKKDLV